MINWNNSSSQELLVNELIPWLGSKKILGHFLNILVTLPDKGVNWKKKRTKKGTSCVRQAFWCSSTNQYLGDICQNIMHLFLVMDGKPRYLLPQSRSVKSHPKSVNSPTTVFPYYNMSYDEELQWPVNLSTNHNSCSLYWTK